jgi:hypothetical protein
LKIEMLVNVIFQANERGAGEPAHKVRAIAPSDIGSGAIGNMLPHAPT